MPKRKLDKAEWAAYFDAFSRTFIRSKRVDYAEIRVITPGQGAHAETSWLPLAGITYDRKDDLLDVAVENVDHLIYHPEEIYVEETGAGILCGLDILRRDGTREVIELR